MSPLDPMPIYDGALGENGHVRMCRCSELASYEVTTVFQGRVQTSDVCTPHMRFLYRGGRPKRYGFDQKEQSGPKVTKCRSFPEYESYLVRMRVWSKRNV